MRENIKRTNADGRVYASSVAVAAAAAAQVLQKDEPSYRVHCKVANVIASLIEIVYITLTQ